MRVARCTCWSPANGSVTVLPVATLVTPPGHPCGPRHAWSYQTTTSPAAAVTIGNSASTSTFARRARLRIPDLERGGSRERRVATDDETVAHGRERRDVRTETRSARAGCPVDTADLVAPVEIRDGPRNAAVTPGEEVPGRTEVDGIARDRDPPHMAVADPREALGQRQQRELELVAIAPRQVDIPGRYPYRTRRASAGSRRCSPRPASRPCRSGRSSAAGSNNGAVAATGGASSAAMDSTRPIPCTVSITTPLPVLITSSARMLSLAWHDESLPSRR